MWLPSRLLGIALPGHAAESAAKAREWIHVLAAELDAVRSAEPGGAAAEALRDADPQLRRLTPREWEIARRIAQGDRASVVAEELEISLNTVRNHLKAIFRKLRITSQTQLVRRLRR